MRRLLVVLCLLLLAGVSGCTYRGIALAGGSFGDQNPLPGTYGSDGPYYDVDGDIRTDPAGLEYLAAEGVGIVRVDFRWERWQPTLNGPLDPTEIARVHALLDAVDAAGLHAILDAHQYGHRKPLNTGGSPQSGPSIGDPQVPLTAWQDFWARVVEEFGTSPGLLGFELDNEPVNMTGGAAQSHAADQAALNAIRFTEARLELPFRPVWADGYGWAKVDNFGYTNGDPWLDDQGRLDPQGEPLLRYTAHHYFDTNADSNYSDLPVPCAPNAGCGEATVSRVKRHLAEFTGWCNLHQVQCAITEVGWPDTAAWNAVAEQWFQDADAADLDVIVWATGCAWGDYELLAFSCEPDNSWHGGSTINTTRGQGALLLAHPAP